MTSEPIQGYRIGAPASKTKNPVDRHRPTPTQAEAHRKLLDAVQVVGSNCKDTPGPWSDIDNPDDVPTPEEAERMCSGCPVFDLCAEYDRLASPSFGVWAGRFRGEEIL